MARWAPEKDHKVRLDINRLGETVEGFGKARWEAAVRLTANLQRLEP